MGDGEDTDRFLRSIKECEAILQKICNLYFDSAADRKDIYQDILLNAWKGYSSFKGDSKFSTWLYRVALNTAFSKLRRSKRSGTPGALEEYAFQIPATDNTELNSNVKILYKALQQLNEMDRTIALLYLDQLSYKEISTITGLTEANIGVRIGRVKDKLKKILSAYGIR